MNYLRRLFGPKMSRLSQKDVREGCDERGFDVIYKSLVENSLAGIYIIQDNQYKYVNRRWCDMHGYACEEVVGSIDPMDTVYREDRPLAQANLTKRLQGENTTSEYEIRIVRKDGQLVWVKVLGNVTNYKGRPAISGTMIDISETKRYGFELQESEIKYRSLVENRLVGVYVIQDNTFRYVNNHFGEIFDYTCDEIVDKMPPSMFVHPEDREKVQENIRKRISGEATSIEYEFKGIKRDGAVIFIKVLGDLMEYKGKPAIMGMLVDITERKIIENALSISEVRLHTLINTIPDLIWLKNADGVYLQCNRRFEAIFGAAEKDIIGKTDYDFVDKELADFFRQKDREAIMAENPCINEEEITYPDGHKEILETIKTPIYERNGKLIGVLGVGRDITQRKQAENELKDNEELFRILLKFIPYSISLTNLNNQFIVVNDAYYVINNVPNVDIIGKTPEQLGFLVDTATTEYIAQQMKAKGKMENLEFTATVGGGKQVISLYSSVMVRWKNEAMILHSSIDITEKKKTEQELEKYRQHLEQLVQERTDELEASLEELNAVNEELSQQKEELENTIVTLSNTRKQLIQSEKMASLGVLSAGIAHEINNPLNFIYGGSIALLDYFEQHPNENRDEVLPLLEAINEGVARAAEIVSSLGQYSRSDELPKEQCQINAIIENCLVMLQDKLKGRIRLIKHYDPCLPPMLGNIGKMHQVMLNVLNNSIQAIENEGDITIETFVEADNVCVRIIDSGMGIGQDIIDKIFDPFFTTKAPGTGTGLGLSITYNIVNEYKGTIGYESEPGKGTAVMIRFPKLKEQPNER